MLLDEIDKAEPDLPNNLLVPLGSREIRPPADAEPVTPARALGPLVCVTSNKERLMPEAFLRRCVVLELQYPGRVEMEAIATALVPGADDGLVERAANHLVPGGRNESISPAEFVDAVRAAHDLEERAGDTDQFWSDIAGLMRTTKPRRR